VSTIKQVLTVFKNQLARIEQQPISLIESCPDYQEKSDIVQSMPGVGKVCAAALIGYMPELGYATNK
jgi:transposase